MPTQRFLEDLSTGHKVDTDLSNLTSDRTISFVDRDVTVTDARPTTVDTSGGNQTVVFDGQPGELRTYRNVGGNVLTVQANGGNVFSDGNTSLTVSEVTTLVDGGDGIIYLVSDTSNAGGGGGGSVTLNPKSILANTTASSGAGTSLNVPASSIVGATTAGDLKAMNRLEADEVLIGPVQNVSYSSFISLDFSIARLFSLGTASGNFTLQIANMNTPGMTGYLFVSIGNNAIVTLSGSIGPFGNTVLTLPSGKCRLEFLNSPIGILTTKIDFS
ncbi:MAG: hypothetical protein D6800_09130 [Candidatus Zixiibacteriota bacterium]|nr:MAG: hypothetical protein D6800_09130 [candidate division Zixibacteria bacterium]